VTPIASRVLQAVSDDLSERNLEDCAGGTVSIVVKLDAAGCPKRIAVRTEVEKDVVRRRPCAVAG
jgi:hypothetical protein